MHQDVEYRGAFLTALVEVISAEEDSLGPSHPSSPGFDEACLQDCVEDLFDDLEMGRGGSGFISVALCAVSLLLYQR